MPRAWPLALVVAIGALGATAYGCALFTELDGFDCGADGCQDAAAAETSTDASNDATSEVGAGDASAEAGRCPEGRGPKMIVAGTFCIDSTEVTAAQYADFVDDSFTFDAGPPPAVCANVTTHVPSCNYAPGAKPNQPVRCVSWCNAWAFCKWSGKRLCGRIGGGSLAPDESRDPVVSQWMAACTRLGQRQYAYGTTQSPTACPGDDVSPYDVGSVATCEGGYPGLFDMNGNVEEWEDACRPADGGVACEKRGNDFRGSGGACSHSFGEDVFEANDDTGIRCCAD